MRVADVMSSPAVTISPDATLSTAIAIMVDRRVSGLPVVDAAGTLVGMLSEGDLLHRSEMGTSRPHSRWIEWMLSPGHLAEDYAAANGRYVRDVMTRSAWTIAHTATLAEAVATMEKHHVKRLPVMRGDAVVGILTRADLVRALARFMAPAYDEELTTDAEIRRRLMAELAKQDWVPHASIEVAVKDGRVTFSGTITDDRQRDGLKVAAETIPGVVAVDDDLVCIEAFNGPAAAYL